MFLYLKGANQSIFIKASTFFLCLVLPIYSFPQSRGLSILANQVAGTEITIGKQYVVLIAIDKYQQWNSLKNPVADAKEIKRILQNRYYVDEFDELYDADATGAGIRKLFTNLTSKLAPTDSVLIYYAGHGYLDASKTGFWIPVDGGTDVDEQDHWIANSQIRNFITQMKARSVALLADASFSGDLLNVQRGATPIIDSAYVRNALKYTARQVLTSGASETVPDESEFARQFKAVLTNNTETCLDPIAMYDRIRRGVTLTLPLLGTLQGHEQGGSYILFLKETKVATVPLQTEVKKQALQMDSKALAEQIRLKQEQLILYQQSFDSSVGQKAKNQSIGTVSLITGGLSGIAAGILYFLGNSANTAYQSATTATDAQAQHNLISLYSTLFVGTASISGVGLGLGAVMFATAPDPQAIERQVQSAMNDLLRLKSEKAVQDMNSGS